MKIIIACLLIASVAFATESNDFLASFSLAEIQKINSLKETRWGSIFLTLAELQSEAGPIEKLIQSLDDLVKELDESKKRENENYHKKSVAHQNSVNTLKTQISNAKGEIAANREKIQKVLQPKIKTATEQNQEASKAITKKEKEIKDADERRITDQKAYERRNTEHTQAIAAADLCITKVQGILTNKGALVEMKDAILSIRQLELKIRQTHATETPFIEALMALVQAQQFDKKETTNKVLTLLQEFRERLRRSQTQEESNEKAAILAHAATIQSLNKGISDAKALIQKNINIISDTKKQISACRDIITIKGKEQDTLEANLKAEEEAFRLETKTHEDIIKENESEVVTVKECKTLFSGHKFGKYTQHKINQIDK